MQMKYKIINLAVLIMLISAALLAATYFSSYFNMKPPERVKNATTYMAPGIIDGPRSDVLKEHTDILGQPIYDINDTLLGTLYDAYIDPENAAVKWISVNIDGDLNKPLILLKTEDFEALDSANSKVKLYFPRSNFLEYPVQKENEERLMNLVSLRGLPSANLINREGNKVGEIISLTYSNGIIDRVYFKASDLILPNEDMTIENRIFSLPFEHLEFIEFNAFNNNAIIGIGLTERQVGAIKKFMEQAQ